MTDINESKGIESQFFIGTNENDVVALEHTTMATEELSVPNTHKDYRMLIGTSGAGSVSALTLNDTAAAAIAAAAAASTSVAATSKIAELTTTTTTTTANVTATIRSNSVENNLNSVNNSLEMKIINNNNIIDNPLINKNANNNNINNNGAKGKRRRRKSKQVNNSKPYKKSNWKFQVPRSRDGRRVSTLVPYNTNKFLMEEHMPEFEAAGGRYRDSSFSIDSDENFDEEEFLSKEFSSVYEMARAERLDEMNKQQLIQEYLQMESNYDKLCNSLKVRNKSKDFQTEIENQNHIKKLEGHIKQLTAENLELRHQMADIRSREHHSPPHGRHRHHSNSYSSKKHPHHKTGNDAVVISSEDSESDSSSSTSSSSSSNSSSDSHSKSKKSRSRSSCSSKSSLSEPNHMSGISDAEEAMHLLNGYDSNGTNAAPMI